MAGTLKPSTTGEEAKYTHLGGLVSSQSQALSSNGYRLFNATMIHPNGGNSEGYYYNVINTLKDYVLLKTEDYCNIYAYSNFNYTKDAEPFYSYVTNSTGKLRILQYDGSDYTIDVTDKYWVGRSFKFGNATTSTSNGLTFEQFLSTELIDRRWQKIVSILPPGQYKFILDSTTQGRRDDEWFLEKIIPYSEKIKNDIVNTIKNHKLIQKYVTLLESEE